MAIEPTSKKPDDKKPAPEISCPCKRTQCVRFNDCDACYQHHHLPGKKMPTACERLRAKQLKSKQ